MWRPIDLVVFKDLEGRSTRLSNQSSRSRNGLPLLCVDAMGVRCIAGPRDELGIPPGGMMRAAELVLYWARQPNRSLIEQDVARLFLRQWPEGPQL
jgi:hypothetical protein